MDEYLPLMVQLVIVFVSSAGTLFLVDKQRRRADVETESLAIATMKAANVELREEFQHLCSIVETLRAELSSARAETARLEAIVGEKDARIASLEQASISDTAEIMKLRARVALLEHQLADSGRQVPASPGGVDG